MRLRRTVVVAAVIMLATGTGAALVAGPGGAQVAIDSQVHLTVNKAVVGTQPAGGLHRHRGLTRPAADRVSITGPRRVLRRLDRS